MPRICNFLIGLSICIVLFSGCVNYQELSHQTETLNAGTPEQKRAAVKYLIEVGSPAVPKLTGLINNSEDQLTIDLAVDAIGIIGDTRGIDPLIGIIRDDRTQHFPAVKKVIIKFPSKDVVPLLCINLACFTGPQLLWTIDILGDFKDPHACPYLVPLLKKNDPATLSAVTKALVKLSPTPIPLLANALNDYDQNYRTNAEAVLIKIGEPACSAMLEKLLSSETMDRESAARVLGGIGNPENIEPLIALFDDPMIGVRRTASASVACYKDRAIPALVEVIEDNQDELLILKQAARSLGLIGSDKAAAVLSNLLKANDSLVREATARSMGSIASPKIIEVLKKALKDPEWRVRKAAAESLRTLKWKPANDTEKACFMVADQDWAGLIRLGNAALMPLKLTLNDQSGWVRRSAVETITSIKRPDEKVLLGILGESSPKLRAAAARALGRLRSRMAEDKLIALLSDSNKEVKQSVIIALGALQSAKAVPALRILLKSPDRNIRGNAVTSMALSGDEAVVADLAVIAEKDYWEVRKRAISGLAAYPSPAAEKALVAALDDQDFFNRKLAAAALKRRDWKPAGTYEKCLFYIANNNWDSIVEMGSKAQPALLLFVDDKNHIVRILAYEMLGYCGSEKDFPVLLKALESDKEPGVREAAGFAVYRLGGSKAAKLLCDLYEASEVPLVRRICCENLGKFRKLNADEQEVLLDALTDTSPKVRVSAATALGRLKVVSAVDKLALMSSADKDNRSRRAAARALRRIGGENALEYLDKLRYNAKDEDVKREAARAFR
jgi:HEAT repeat protein